MTSWSFPELRPQGLARALLPVALAAAGPCLAGCGQALGTPRVLQGAHHQLAYAVRPVPIRVGQHFSMDVVACPGAGGETPNELVVDARMVDHGHGMGYRPKAVRVGAGHWRVDGFMFHMSGKWTLSFDVVSGPNTDRISEAIVMK